MDNIIKLNICFIVLTFVIGVGVLGNSKPEPAAPMVQASIPEPSIPEIRAVIIDPEDQECLAKNIYHEARGESFRGQLAVAHVTMNRVHSTRYPNTVCGVVYQGRTRVNWQGHTVPALYKCQFSWYCDGRSDAIANRRAWNDAMEIAEQVLAGNILDPTHGATHYYNPNKADPAWKNSFLTTAQIDNHTFMRRGG